MSPAQRSRRARPGRLARLADQFDEVGRRGVLALWWLLAQGVRLLSSAASAAALTPGAGSGAAPGGPDRRARPAGRAMPWWAGAGTGPIATTTRSTRPRRWRRVIHSEVGGQSRQQRLHVAWATRNLAAERGQTIVEMVCSPCGPQGVGRPESSRQDATDDDRVLARSVLAAPGILNPTGGATHFIDPLLQDQLATARAPGYVGRPYRVVERRWREGSAGSRTTGSAPRWSSRGPAGSTRRHRHRRRRR